MEYLINSATRSNNAIHFTIPSYNNGKYIKCSFNPTINTLVKLINIHECDVCAKLIYSYHSLTVLHSAIVCGECYHTISLAYNIIDIIHDVWEFRMMHKNLYQIITNGKLRERLQNMHKNLCDYVRMHHIYYIILIHNTNPDIAKYTMNLVTSVMLQN